MNSQAQNANGGITRRASDPVGSSSSSSSSAINASGAGMRNPQTRRRNSGIEGQHQVSKYRSFANPIYNHHHHHHHLHHQMQPLHGQLVRGMERAYSNGYEQQQQHQRHQQEHRDTRKQVRKTRSKLLANPSTYLNIN